MPIKLLAFQKTTKYSRWLLLSFTRSDGVDGPPLKVWPACHWREHRNDFVEQEAGMRVAVSQTDKYPNLPSGFKHYDGGFMKRVPLRLAGALLLAGSLSAYAQTERLQKDDNGGAAKQAPAQGEAPQTKPQGNSQEKPRAKEGQGAQAQDKREGPGGQAEKSGDKAQGAQADSKEKREPERPQSGQAENKDKRDGDKSAGDAGKQQGGGDHAKGQKHAGKKLEAKQRTVVKETIVKRNVRPVHVTFSINVGAVVPRSYELYDLPPVLIEYEPGYSRYKFILADDDTILVIDPETWTIVDIIEV